MNKAHRPIWSTRPAKVQRFGVTALVVALILAGLIFWQFNRARPLTPAPYAAPMLELFLMGAVPATMNFSMDELSDVSVTPSGFRFVTPEDATLSFRLEFQGVSEAEARGQTYELMGGAYPLTLTLLEDGHAYGTFTAFDGTVTLSEDGGTVAAFLLNAFGEQIFLSARFRRPAAS